ncbi:hypothetical protein [Actinokineospora inagensis]|uniref:hypothetical protein n=1 Tax=Actinokineospora inagensis TaxID=103730 RepID=UPI00041B170E|nr:hypothetical protein [Actinokineospora inagensis]
MDRYAAQQPSGFVDDGTLGAITPRAGEDGRVVVGAVLNFTRAEQQLVSCYDSLEA